MLTGSGSVRVLLAVMILCMAFWGCSRQESSSVPSAETETKHTPEKAVEAKSTDLPQSVRSDSRSQSQLPSEPRPAEKEMVEIEAVSFDSNSPVTGDTLKAVVVTSGGGDAGKAYSCRWKINGQEVQKSESDVLGHPIKRGDFVEVEVAPSGVDPESKYVSCYITVANAPPVVRLESQNLGSDGKYEAKLEASDPEKDNITFRLKSGPAGMSIDAASGNISWTASANEQGTFGVQVSAKDAQGAETLFMYQIKVRLESGGGG